VDEARGWFVANVSELEWQENELGATCEFDRQRERFNEFGINLTVLGPRQPMTMYHREGYQEGFLILRGECLLIVEGQEVPLRQSEYFHCPADVAHAIVGPARDRHSFSPSGAASAQTRSSTLATRPRSSTAPESSKRRQTRRRPTYASRGPRRASRFAASSSRSSPQRRSVLGRSGPPAVDVRACS
jgi:quercetin dioxygenase-like cupin family protein